MYNVPYSFPLISNKFSNGGEQGGYVTEPHLCCKITALEGWYGP
jgi:hypothetical protein